jgi:hypothetical protein
VAKVKTDDLVVEIEQTRERLAGTIDQLIDRTSPKTIARRGVASVKGRFVTAEGKPRLENIVPVVGGAVALVGLLVVVRRIVR